MLLRRLAWLVPFCVALWIGVFYAVTAFLVYVYRQH